MNKIHRTVWSETRQAYVVAHEKAATHGKPSSTRKAVASAAAAALLALGVGEAMAAACPAASGGLISVDNTTVDQQCTLGNAESLTVSGTGSISISGQTNPVIVNSGISAGNITNSGTIENTGTGGSVDNAGIMVFGAMQDIVNNSVIRSDSGGAISISSGGLARHVSNTGTITGQTGLNINSASLTGSITNSGTLSRITGSYTGIFVAAGTVDGSIVNQGLISGQYAGIGLYYSGTISSGIANSGTIQGPSWAGLAVVWGSALNGGITNSGTIASTNSAGLLVSSAAITGGITNSGQITGGTAAIQVGSGGLISGGILNTLGGTIGDIVVGLGSASTGTITGGDGIFNDDNGTIGNIIVGAGSTISGTTRTGIRGDSGSVFDGITNAGRIQGSAYGIELQDASLNGSIINLSSGVIQGNNLGISLGTVDVDSIQNAGLITTTTDSGLYLSSSSVAHGITNTGSIQGRIGLYVTGSTVSGGIINQGGTIQGTGTNSWDEGLYFGSWGSSTSLTGNISNLNDGTKVGKILGANNGLVVSGSGGGISGKIENEGVIRGTANAGIIVTNTATIANGITNSGTLSLIEGGHTGIILKNSSAIGGSIYNEGTISGNQTKGIYLSSSSITGGITNSGTLSRIIGGYQGISLESNAFIGGSIYNEGTIFGGSNAGISISSSSLTGGITNSGTLSSIEGLFTGIALSSSSLGGSIRNEGTISGRTAIYIGGSSVGGSIVNQGTIIANGSTSANAIYLGGGSTITSGITNSGAILASATTNAYGIAIWNSSSVSGGLTNSGTINASAPNGFGVDVRYSSTLSGGLTNSGLISGTVGIGIGSNGDVAGGISNQAGGRIVGTGGIAMALFGNSAVDVSNANTATISGAIYGNASVINSGLWALPENPTSANNYIASSLTGSFSNTGTLRIGAYGTGAGEYSQITVGGTATLGGTMDVDVKNGSPLTQGNTLVGVIHATGGISGTFAHITDNSALFDFAGIYGANDFDLTIVATGSGGGGGGSGGVTEQIVATQGNAPATGAARALDTIFSSAPAGPIATLFLPLTTDRQVSNAVSQTLPLLTGGSQIAAGAALTGINRVVQARIESNRGLSSGDSFYGDKRVWMKPFGSWADQDDRKGVSGYSARTGGLAFGADATVSDTTRLGLSFAYAKASVTGNSSVAPNSAGVDVYQLVGYGSHALDEHTEVNFQAGVGMNRNRGNRQILFAGSTAHADFDSLTATFGAGFGRTFKLDEQTSFTPSVRADYTWIKDKAYTETGAGVLNLGVAGRTSDELVLAADGKLTKELGKGTTLSANLGIGYDALSRQASITAAYAGAPGAAFQTKGLDPSPWLLRGGLGVSSTTQSGMEVSARYDAEYRDSFLNQTLSAKLRWAF